MEGKVRLIQIFQNVAFSDLPSDHDVYAFPLSLRNALQSQCAAEDVYLL